MREAALQQPRSSGFPLVDRLGELCISGRDSAAYLSGSRTPSGRKLTGNWWKSVPSASARTDGR